MIWWRRLAAAEAIVVLVLDQLSKFLVFHEVQVPEDGMYKILPIFAIVHWWNKGVSFGMFNGAQDSGMQFGILVILTLIIVTLLLYSLSRSTRRVTICALGLIIGGAIGNLADRFIHGAVADFLYFHWGPHGFPAFNLADSCVCVGVGLLLLDGLRSQKADKSVSFIDS